MSDVDLKLKAAPTVPAAHARFFGKARRLLRPRHVTAALVTLLAVGLAAVSGSAAWNAYMEGPWTRDATVRAYVVTMAPQVSGLITELPVSDNQFIHKGDPLMVIDPTDYRIGVSLAEAALEQARATAQNAETESRRRQALDDLAATTEEKEVYATNALAAQAAYRHASANLDQANVNLGRTRILSPVNGYVTNLQVQRGDYVNIGQKSISVVNVDTFWIDCYFEETSLSKIHERDAAAIKLLGYRQVLKGHVESIARGINVPNAQADAAGLATVNPVFTWVRLAQRVPIRIRIDEVPADLRLVIGMTATVEINSHVQRAP
ncbi:efflux RND transporter periplasmic adaptor subunit [Bradyrhizobium sp. Pha-3]|uniref:efflux RND transporter periplasmic adaptor subunit n=1 Tax=Bradyrhizobium sp. Pha-3 TaxID=208375 RepID=UPI0035D5134F